MLARGRPAVALAVMVDVALHAGRGAVAAAEIGARLGLSRRGLEPLMQALVRAGLLASTRGPTGGYRLARARRAISVADVVAAVATEPGAAEALPAGEGEEGALFAAVVGPYWSELESVLRAELARTSIEALCRRAAAAGLSRAPAEPLVYVI